MEKSKSLEHHSNDYYRNYPFKNAKISGRKEKENIYVTSKYHFQKYLLITVVFLIHAHKLFCSPSTSGWSLIFLPWNMHWS
jgi:hypothetical protein